MLDPLGEQMIQVLQLVALIAIWWELRNDA